MSNLQTSENTYFGEASKPGKKVIFWDFDGVIADSKEFVFNYWQKALAEAGYDFKEADFQATFDVKMPFDYLHDQYGTIAREITQKYSEYERHFYANLVHIFPQMKDILGRLTTKYDFFIISANLAEVIDKTLKKNAIGTYFQQIMGRETHGHKDEKIENICQEHGYKKEDGIFVGDTVSDINHAKMAKLDCVGVTWGIHSRKKLQKVSPNFLVDTPNALYNLLK